MLLDLVKRLLNVFKVKGNRLAYVYFKMKDQPSADKRTSTFNNSALVCIVNAHLANFCSEAIGRKPYGELSGKVTVASPQAGDIYRLLCMEATGSDGLTRSALGDDILAYCLMIYY